MPKSRKFRVRFAKAVYCPGVDTWYLRFGSQHGIDVMFKQRSESSAKLNEELVNASLNRELNQHYLPPQKR